MSVEIADVAPAVRSRLLGNLAAIGGVAWIVGVALALILPTDEYGDHDNAPAVISLAIGASLIGIVLGQLGTRPGSSHTGRSRTGLGIGIAATALGLTAAMGWPMFMVFLVGYPILALLATARAYMTGGLSRGSALIVAATAALAMVGVLRLPELGGPADAFALFGLMGVGGLALAVAAVRPEAYGRAGSFGSG